MILDIPRGGMRPLGTRTFPRDLDISQKTNHWQTESAHCVVFLFSSLSLFIYVYIYMSRGPAALLPPTKGKGYPPPLWYVGGVLE